VWRDRNGVPLGFWRIRPPGNDYTVAQSYITVPKEATAATRDQRGPFVERAGAMAGDRVD